MDSRNRMNCDERIRTSAAHSQDRRVNVSGPITMNEGSYPSAMANKLRCIKKSKQKLTQLIQILHIIFNSRSDSNEFGTAI